MATKRIIHGDDLLYRFFQEQLSRDPHLARRVPQLLIMSMGIWLPLEAYERWPILLPWVVRDPKCRGNRAKGLADEWSSPDAKGYLRDDNSLVKGLARSLTVQGPKGGRLAGARMGSEFVASHVWRVVKHKELASRIPRLNSFIPNLVWLPGQVAKLTDREGSIVQQALQAISYRIYRAAPVRPELEEVVDEAWAMIPEPSQNVQTFKLDDLNWFTSTDGFFRIRSARLSSVVSALGSLEAGEPLPPKVVTSRYAAGLPQVPAASRAKLKTFLQQFEVA